MLKNTDIDFISYLREISLFSDIREIPEAMNELVIKLTMRKFKAGEAIIVEGETGSELFLLVQGQASVYKTTIDGDSYKVAILQAQDHVFFGEGGLLASDPRSATIKADIGCTCLVLNSLSIDQFGRDHPQWALPIFLKIARTVMERSRKANDDLMLLYNALVSEIRGN